MPAEASSTVPPAAPDTLPVRLGRHGDAARAEGGAVDPLEGGYARPGEVEGHSREGGAPRGEGVEAGRREDAQHELRVAQAVGAEGVGVVGAQALELLELVLAPRR